MKFLLTVSLSVEDGNDLIKSGEFPKTLQRIMEDVKPEAIYFGPTMGTRAMFLILNIADGSKIPAALEPFWLALGASVDVTPIFTMEEMQKAGPDIEAAAKRY